MNYYNEIKNKLIDNEINEKIKDYSKERYRVITYFEVGKMLSAAGKHYGENIIGKYAERLINEVGKKYNKRTLFRMRQFYNVFSNKKMSLPGTQLNLSWSHYRALLPLKNYGAINYYISICISQRLSKTELENKIKLKEYDRLSENAKEKFKNKEKPNIKDTIPNPIIIKNTLLQNKISEKVLQKIIMEDISSFLKQLGEGYTFIDNEYKIKMGERYNYIDLLLYNIKYKCYVVIELKVTELKSEHIGQITKYINYIDKNIKTINEDKTIGIIICKKENSYIIEYASDNRIAYRTFKIIN